ncbi:12855_t:CDS:2, partial [Gigaspora rosea]
TKLALEEPTKIGIGRSIVPKKSNLEERVKTLKRRTKEMKTKIQTKPKNKKNKNQLSWIIYVQPG